MAKAHVDLRVPRDQRLQSVQADHASCRIIGKSAGFYAIVALDGARRAGYWEIMAETKTYAGSCHCGNVRYEVTTALESLMQCNCSICSRAGYLMSFVQSDQFKLLAGDDKTTDYLFNKHKIHHPFCTTCGIRSFGWGAGKDGAKMYMINVRCLEGVEHDAFEIKKVDGKSY